MASQTRIYGFWSDDLTRYARGFIPITTDFNVALQQIFQVRAVDNVPGLLDLELAEDEEFSPDKLRATLERFYMDVVCSMNPVVAIMH